MAENDNNICEQTSRPCPFDPIKMGEFFQLARDIKSDVKDIKDEQKNNSEKLNKIPVIEEKVTKLEQHETIRNGRIGKLEKFRYYIIAGFMVTLFIMEWAFKLFSQ